MLRSCSDLPLPSLGVLVSVSGGVKMGEHPSPYERRWLYTSFGSECSQFLDPIHRDANAVHRGGTLRRLTMPNPVGLIPLALIHVGHGRRQPVGKVLLSHQWPPRSRNARESGGRPARPSPRARVPLAGGRRGSAARPAAVACPASTRRP